MFIYSTKKCSHLLFLFVCSINTNDVPGSNAQSTIMMIQGKEVSNQ
ncbi:unnamed protein product [Amoebophrya sp. A120]|nr:unnamed protein product [Amoebophrya sp. A120]|eukprot:GSA120T00009575001.1